MLIKAFRLFVSSTFVDFTAERDVLQRDVFPALDSYCTARGYQFYPLDLRWGVNEEAQLDQRTAEICLNEVRAAKADYPPPNFLILIGNRYGFVPLPYAIAQDEFEAIVAWLEGRDRQDAASALRAVYQHDGNYLVPRGLFEAGADGGVPTSAYTLRSRADELPEFRPAEAWAEREAELRRALQEAANGLLALGQTNTAAHEKYFLSLTDQEIMHGLPGYGPVANSASRASPGTDGPPAIAFIREIVSESGAPPLAIRHYFEQEPRLDELKVGIRRALPEDHVITARTTVDEDGRLSETYLADFAAQIQGKLKSAIDQHIAGVEALERAPDFALESERAAHRTFGEQKLKIFVGREKELAAVARYLAGASEHPLVLHGRSGLGKSALMARAIALAEAAAGPPVVARFVGASAASSNLRALLISVIEDLAAHGIAAVPGEFEQDANKFDAQIEKLLSSITNPVIVFLDALDQLQKPHDLGWLPAKLSNGLKLVVSVLDDAAYETDSGLYRDVQNRLAPDAFLDIGPLGSAQGREILSALEQQAQHRLQDSQRDYIIDKFEQAGASPLYLKTAFEITGCWKSYHMAGAGRFVVAEDTGGVIAQLIAELSSVHHHEPELVTRTLGYLAAAKNGLSAKELTDALSRDVTVMQAISSERHGSPTDKLPPSVWVRLYRDLAPFVVEKQIDDQPLLHFFHRQVAQVAHVQHYERCKTELHTALAAYFESQATQRDGKAIYGKRSLSELPFQLDRAENTSRLGEILMSPDWMQQKLAAFGIRSLISDYQYARTRAQKLVGQALELAAGPLARDERQLAAQIIGRVTADLVEEAAETVAIEGVLKKARALVTPPALVPRWPHLTAPGGPEIRRLEGHTATVNAVAFSPDGRHIVSGGDKTLRLWEATSGREIARFEGHTEWVEGVAFSPDGRHLVSGSGDKTLRLWEAASGQSRRLEGHTDVVNDVAFSPDGRRIVSGSCDRTLRMWEAASGREIARFEGHTEWVEGVAFSPDGRHIASGSRDKTLRLWEVASGQSRRLEGHTDRVQAVAFSPDGRHIVSGSRDKSLRLWEVASGLTRRFEGHTDWVQAVAFSPDGRYIVSGGDKTLRLWEATSGREIARFEGHTGWVQAVAFSPDGRHLVSGSEDKTLRLWEASSGQSRHREGHANGVNAVASSPDGRYIVSGSGDKTLRLWEAISGREIARFEGHTDQVVTVAFSSDGRHIVSGSWDKTLGLWETASGHSRRLEGHTRLVHDVASSPDGRHIASGSADKTLRRWEAASGQSLRFEGHTDQVLVVAFSPDGRHIASGSSDNTLRLWDAASGREVARLDGHTAAVTVVAFSPDGRHIISGSWDATLRLWEVSSGQSRRLEGHTDFVMTVAFSPDGQHIVSGSDSDNTLRLWEASSGRSRRLEGHTGFPTGVAFSSDGRHIVSGSNDKTLRLWEVASGREIARFEGEGSFCRFALLPDGKSLAAGDNGGRVHLLDILVDQSDKTIWLDGLASGGGPAQRGGDGVCGRVATATSRVHRLDQSQDRAIDQLTAARPSRTSDRAMSTGKPNADQTRQSALRRLFAALIGKPVS